MHSAPIARQRFDLLVYVPFPSKRMAGAPRSMLALSEGLHQAGHRVAVLTHVESAFREACQQRGIPVHVAPVPGSVFENEARERRGNVAALFRDIRRARQAADRALDGIDARIVCARSSLAVMFVAPAVRKRKILLVWDIALEPGIGLVRWTLGLAAGLNASRWVLQSRHLRDRAVPGVLSAIFRGRIRENVPGMDAARLAKMAEVAASRQVRPKRNAADDLDVLCIGSVCRRKNQSCLIDASCLAAVHTGRRVRVTFVGDCSDDRRKELSDRIASRDVTVVFDGWQPEVSRYLEQSDVLCIPSLAEGVPQVLREGMAAGIPILASDIGGIRSSLRHGVTGLLFHPKAPAQLARHLKFAIEHPREIEAMGWAAREANLPMLENQGWLARYEAMLQELWGSTGSHA